MTEPMTAQDVQQAAIQDLERRLALVTDELSEARKAIEEKSRELEEITASLQARLHERTCDLEVANEKLQRFDELHSAFWAIE
jgi:hypothetical protein